MIDPETIWTSQHLPTLPTVAVELLKLTKDPDSGIADIVALVKTDPAISAKILKVVNSSFFGVSSRVTSLERAVGLLGGTYVTSIALSFYLSNAASATGPLAEQFSRYWLQSVVQATAAETLGRRTKQGTESELFLAGLMLDLGRLAMLKAIPEDYLNVMSTAAQQPRDLCEIERQSLGVDHTEIGARLAENWTLPESLIELIRWHHTDPDQVDDGHDAPDDSLRRALAIAACIGDFFCAHNLGVAFERLTQLAGRDYEMDQEGVTELLNDVWARIAQVADQFSAEANVLDDPTALMAEANAQLAQLAVRENVANLQASARHEAAVQAKQDLESLHHELRQQSQYDRVTAVYNRAYFDEALDAEVGRCVQSARPLGLIFCDIDRFKESNDTYGHQFGDQILTQVAAAFREVLRPDDVLARYGGDEFVVLVSNPTLKGLEKLSERIRQRIEAESFDYDGHPVNVRVSLGAALDIPGRNSLDVGARVIAAADQEMYKSKRDGGNRSRVRSLVGEFSARLEQFVNQYRFSRWLATQQVLEIPVVSQSLLHVGGADVRIGQLAITRRVLGTVDVQEILAEQECTGERFGEVALRLGLLNVDQLVDLLILQRENPQTLAEVIVSQGSLDATEMQCALEAYVTSRSDVMTPGLPPADDVAAETTENIPTPQ